MSQEAVKETKDENRRTFKFMEDTGTESTYYLSLPSSDQIRKSDWHYSKVYNKALIDGVATQAEMLDILKQRNIYGPEYEEKLTNLKIQIALKIVQLEQMEGDPEKGKLAQEIKDLRDQLFQWNQRLTGPLSNTCEQIAEDAKSEYLVSAMVHNSDGKPVWASYEDFVANANQRLSVKSRYEFLLWKEGLDADAFDNMPEEVVLRDLQAKRQVKQIKALAEESEQVADEALVKAEDLATVKKPKKSRKV
jgi:hypothetical protein